MKKVDFLPVSKEDMDKRGWKQLDFLYIVGDAYVDHPSFGHAIISRVLESHGYKVGIVALPDWHTIDDFYEWDDLNSECLYRQEILTVW